MAKKLKAEDTIVFLSDYVELQRKLLKEMKNRHGTIVEQELYKYTRSGEIAIEGRCWEFYKHGAGIAFVDKKNGTRVDIHKCIGSAELFDEWRLITYFGSLGNRGKKILFQTTGVVQGSFADFVRIWLGELVKNDLIERDGDVYRIK